MLFLSFCVHTVNGQRQHTPFGALQVRPVTQEVGEEAVEFCHTGPEDAIHRKTHTLEPALVSSYWDVKAEEQVLIKEGVLHYIRKFTVKKVCYCGCSKVILTFACRTEVSKIWRYAVQTTTFWARVQPVDEIIYPGVGRNTYVGSKHHQQITDTNVSVEGYI